MGRESLTPGDRSSDLRPWTLIRQAFALWIGAVLLIPGAIFSTIGSQLVRTDRRFATEGLTVDASVLHKSIVPADHAGNSRTRYVVTYGFAAAGGRLTEGTSDVTVDQWEALETGSTLPVTYLPDAPHSNRPTGANDRIVALVFSAIGSVFVVIGGGLTFGGVRTIRRTRHVARHGFATHGTVIRVAPVATSINRVRQWRIRYEFRDYLGQIRQGESHLLSPEEATRWRAGDTGSVRCHHDRPELSVWMGRA